MSETGVPDRVPEPAGSDPGDERIDARYDTLERGDVVGVGGNATVYEARLPDGTALVLKEPHLDSPVPETVGARFEDETAAWRRVDDHPDVVTVHGAGADPHPWLALERVGGGSLREHDPGVAETLWLGVRLADALAHAHEAGVAHLDVTPGNVLLRETPGDTWPRPALTDWGVAAVLEDGAANLEGLSPRYAAPEQFAPDRFDPPGAHTDVYQLGAVLYELLTEETPHTGPPAALRDAVLEEPPAPATGLNPDLPAAVDDVLDRALAKDPADRPTAAAFAESLADVLAAETGYEPTLPDRAEPGSARAVEASDAAAPYDRAITLDEQGFVQLTDGYFARREPAEPLAAWRRGLDLVDVRAGRAVPRDPPTTADGDDGPFADVAGESMTEVLVETLRDGTDCAVLGPPGSGKSTVCKRVACEWFERDYGPVFYRESGGPAFDEPAALARELARSEGHALVVVEDAVRPGAEAVFDLLDRIEDAGEVSVLVDARENEWREAGSGPGPFGDDRIAAGRERLATTYVPRPDEGDLERFVTAVRSAIDREIAVDPGQLLEDVRRARAGARDESEGGTQPGELFYLIHRLTALLKDPTARDTPSTLTEAVTVVREDLAAMGDIALDVGMTVNLLNAAGVGVHPELVYAVAPDDPVAVDDAIEVLDGHVLFPLEADWSEGTTSYPAVHEAWSTEYLAGCLGAAGEEEPQKRFGRVVTRILSVADDGELRERVAEILHRDESYFERVVVEPEEWADETVERIFRMGRIASDLAPLFGETTESTIQLPESCSSQTFVQQAYWRGEMYLADGDLGRAEREFHTLRERADTVEIDDMTATEPVVPFVADEYTIDEAGDREETQRTHWRGGSYAYLAMVARKRGEFETAAEYLDQALALFRDAGDRHGEAFVLNSHGAVALQRGELESAAKYLGQSLPLYRDIEDRQGEAKCLNNLGLVERKRGDLETAMEHVDQSLVIKREVGDRTGAARSLAVLGTVACQRGKLEVAEEYLREALALFRETGDREGEALSLKDLGTVARLNSDLETAVAYLERSLELFRETGNRPGEALNLGNLGEVARERGELETAEEYHEESLRIKREVGNRHGEATSFINLGIVARKRGDLETAVEHFEESLAIYREIDDRQREARTLNHLGEVARERGDVSRARSRFENAADLYLETGSADSEAAVENIVDICERQGDLETAREWCQRAIEFAEETDRPEMRETFEARRAELTHTGS